MEQPCRQHKCLVEGWSWTSMFGAGMGSRLTSSVQCISQTFSQEMRGWRGGFPQHRGLSVPSQVGYHTCGLHSVVDVELPISSCSPSTSLLCIQLCVPAEVSLWKCSQARDSCDIAEPSSAAGLLLLMQEGAPKNSSLLSSYVFLTGSF